MTYAFTPAPRPALPIKGSDQLFPIHRVYCVGRNYAEHTREMGGDTKDPPFFFQKNADNVVVDGKFPYPSATQNVPSPTDSSDTTDDSSSVPPTRWRSTAPNAAR